MKKKKKKKKKINVYVVRCQKILYAGTVLRSPRMTPNIKMIIIVIAFLLGVHYCLTITTADVVREEAFENNATQSDTTRSTTNRSPTCPDVLIEKDGKIVLFASKLQKVPGVNPIVFDNLEDYVEFTEWQRSKGITCPVLYMQNTHNAQGGTEYRVRPSITDPQGGLPPSQTPQRGSANTQMDGVNDAAYFSGGGGSITGEKALNTGVVKTGYVNGSEGEGTNNKSDVPGSILQGMTQSSFYQGTITPMDEELQKQKALAQSPSAMDASWGGKDYTNSRIDAGDYAGRTRTQ